MIEKEKFDELQKKQDDLRLKRNKLADGTDGTVGTSAVGMNK